MKNKRFLGLVSLLLAATLTGCAGGDGNAQQTSYISMDNARTAALSAAGVDAGTASIEQTQLTERDGIAYYEVEFTAADVEYSYAIDAMTGVVIEAKDLKLDQPPVSGDQVTDYDTSDTNSTDAKTDNAQTPPPTAQPVETIAPPHAAEAGTAEAGTTAEITLEQAKRTALDHAGKTSGEVTFVKTEKDFDDGQWIYEIEFIVLSGNSSQEYDYEISVATGKILSYDMDAESYTPQKQESTTKTEDAVRKIALAKVPGAKKEHCILHLEQDDGRLIYEGKILYDGMEYEFEIDAYSGTVLDWEAEAIDD